MVAEGGAVGRGWWFSRLVVEDSYVGLLWKVVVVDVVDIGC